MFKAYTLMEVLIVLFLTNIALLLSIPCFNTFFQQKNSDIPIHNITSLIKAARSEAIKRNRKISICPSKNGSECGGDWQDGQIVIDKKNQEILAFYPRLPEGCFLSLRNSFGRNTELIFTPMGFADGQKSSFVYRAKDGSHFEIAIEKTGRWRIVNGS